MFTQKLVIFLDLCSQMDLNSIVQNCDIMCMLLVFVHDYRGIDSTTIYICSHSNLSRFYFPLFVIFLLEFLNSPLSTLFGRIFTSVEFKFIIWRFVFIFFWSDKLWPYTLFKMLLILLLFTHPGKSIQYSYMRLLATILYYTVFDTLVVILF